MYVTFEPESGRKHISAIRWIGRRSIFFPFLSIKFFSIFNLQIKFLKSEMPGLKKGNQELHQRIVSYRSLIISSLTFRLACSTFTKTRFCSHINLMGHSYRFLFTSQFFFFQLQLTGSEFNND